MATYTIDSNPEPNRTNYTRLVIEDDPAQPLRVFFRYFDGTRLHPALAANLDRLFTIRFRRFNLATPLQQMLWRHIEYVPAARPKPAYDPATRKLVLTYENVPGSVTKDKHPVWLSPTHPVHDPIAVDPIDVTITISPALRNLNHGWINFDIHHTYPSQVPARSTQFAYEQEILFPRFDFSQSGPERFAEPILAPLKFSAIYTKTELGAPETNIATGIAVHVEDEQGHATDANYEEHVFEQTLRNSMHFLRGAFVRPADYQLSRPDAFGFGGNTMMYRLRAFRQKGACPGVPVDWYDVADVYRDWLGIRYATEGQFYKKLRPGRPANAPADTMSPHTVIPNWGIDGSANYASDLGKMLELHPALNHADPTRPLSLAQLAKALKAKFPATLPVKPEVQLWGIELAGIYQFLCGHPHLADAIHGAGTFKKGVGELAAERAVTSVTTDPMSIIFNRARYGGHIRWKGGVWSEARLNNIANWEVMIPVPFAPQVVAATHAVTQGKIGTKTFNRVWYVDGIGTVIQPIDEPNPVDRPHVTTMNAGQKRNAWGWMMAEHPVIGNGLYRAEQKQICPTEEVADLYVNEWVATRLLAHDVRIVEFMKSGAYFCFRTDHRHIVPAHTDTRYDNVIGVGSWYVRRLQSIFDGLHVLGQPRDADPLSSFRLTHEFVPAEALVPYVDQTYGGKNTELFYYVYSHLVTPMMSPGRGGMGIHPGYRERKLGTAVVQPSYMLNAARDNDPVLPQQTKGMTEAEVAALYTERQASFNAWRNACVSYFKANFAVESWGLAPRGYPTGPATGDRLEAWNESDPLASTNPPTYTYNRCVQQTFNARANIFATAGAAVRGLRIMIPSAWLEPPNDYELPALDHAVLAARLQIEHARFFRFGRMLGETRIVRVNGGLLRQLCAWGSGGLGARSFTDVKPLVDFIAADDAELGKDWSGRELKDFISKGWDKQSEDTDVVIADQVQHRVWEHVDSAGVRRVLYAFANLGNGPADVIFFYGRGLEGTTAAAPWRRTIHIIGRAPSAPAPAWAGHIEENFQMPPRSFAAVVVEP